LRSNFVIEISQGLFASALPDFISVPSNRNAADALIRSKFFTASVKSFILPAQLLGSRFDSADGLTFTVTFAMIGMLLFFKVWTRCSTSCRFASSN
jgi:hypothetical protein